MSCLNTEFYSGKDQYSDGDIENDILQYVTVNEPDDYQKVLQEDRRFPVFYHLSDYRKHLIDWYPFDKDASLLEIGGGMGAFTRMFCQRCANVTTVELSKRRAQTIQQRCRDQKNLEIIVGDVMSIDFKQKYDYITVLGVLEYQSVYSASPNPEIDFLNRLCRCLKPNGRLFVAIENRMGLKYWCGDVEDHCGIPFTSINNYTLGGKARTFDKFELEEIVRKSGFSKLKFYYPLPDYKFPRVLYTDQYLPQGDVEACVVPNYYAGTFHAQYPLVADERNLYASIARNGVFPFFANSFLVECAAESDCSDNGISFVSTTAERNNAYLIQTVIQNDQVHKQAAHRDCIAHIEHAFRNIEALKQRGFDILDHVYQEGVITTPFMNAPILEESLIKALRDKDYNCAKEIINSVYKGICRASDTVPESECAIYTLGLDQAGNTPRYAPVLKHAYCDMIFSNAFDCGSTIKYYDQEWVYDNIPANFVLYRGLKIIYSVNKYLDDVIPLQHWLDEYTISPHRAIYDKLESILFADVQNDTICSIIGSLRSVPENTIQNNIRLLTQGNITIQTLSENLEHYQQAFTQQQNDIQVLESALNQREKDVSTLETALNQYAVDVTSLEAVLNQRAADVATLETALNQRAADVATLETALNQRAADVATLETALNQRAEDVANLETALNQRTSEAETLKKMLDLRTQDVELMESKLQAIEKTWLYRIAIKIIGTYNAIKKVFIHS